LLLILKRILILTAILVMANNSLKSQNKVNFKLGIVDSIRKDLTYKKEFYICLDGKNSIIQGLNLKMFGLQAGYSFNNRTNLFLGYYSTLGDKSRIYDNPTAEFGKTDSNTINSTYGTAYFNIGGEYYFYNSKRWRLTFPVAIGLGTGWDQLYNSKKTLQFKREFTMPIELGFYASYKIKWWLWFGGGAGTRISTFAPQYSGPFYTYGFSLRFGEIYNRGRKALGI
jgi:hypothetical protein